MSESEPGAIIPSPGPADDQTGRWRSEFPYHWDADDLVSRRELLHFVIYTSATLFGATTLLAVLGVVVGKRPTPVIPVAHLAEVPEGQAVYFNYPGPEDQAVLLHLPGGQLVAYSQKCTHLSCAVYHQPELGRLYCPCHEGVFDPSTGDPVAGPPRRRLPRIVLRRDGDLISAVGWEA